MKKFLTILLLIISVSLTLAACSKESDSKKTNSETKKAEIQKVSTSLGEVEVIPLRNGLKEILPDRKEKRYKAT